MQKKDYTTAKLRKKLAEGGYPEKITEEALCEAYEVDADTARADVEKLLSQWQELGIVE